MVTATELEGVWRLLGEEYVEADGTVKPITATDRFGKLVYSGGHMMAVVGPLDRDKPSDAKARMDLDGYSVEAEFPVKVSEFNITKPTYLGVGVQDQIRIKISLTATSATPSSSFTTSRRPRGPTPASKAPPTSSSRPSCWQSLSMRSNRAAKTAAATATTRTPSARSATSPAVTR